MKGLIDSSKVNNVMTDPEIDDANNQLGDREIARRGQDIYDRVIRAQVETSANLGRLIAIDIETGHYQINDNLLAASIQLQEQFPHAIIWAERIGFNAVYAVGGTLTKVNLS